MPRRIPVLMYHEVAPQDQIAVLSRNIHREYVMTTDRFDAQMHYLAANGFRTLSPNDLVSALSDKSLDVLPEKSVLITFDDGFAGNYHHALPILRHYNLTATFFVIVNGLTTPYMMTWTQLQFLATYGMSIQSHLMDHIAMAELARQMVFQELEESRRILAEQLGTTVDFFSLPHGSHHADHNQCAREAGYKAGFCSRLGFAHAGSDPYLIERVPVLQSMSLERFTRIVHTDAGVLTGAKMKKKIHTVLDRCLGESRVNRLYHRFHHISNPHPDAV